MPYCPTCGHEVAVGVAFCPQCGAAQGVGVIAPIRQYAGFWRRVVGRIIDSIITGVIGGVIGSAIAVQGLVGGGRSPEEAALNGVGFLVSLAYFWYFNARGQTLGQAAMGVRIIDAEGNPPGSSKALIRVLVSFVSGLALGLGFLWAAFHPEKRTWHDLAAGTWVVRV